MADLAHVADMACATAVAAGAAYVPGMAVVAHEPYAANAADDADMAVVALDPYAADADDADDADYSNVAHVAVVAVDACDPYSPAYGRSYCASVPRPTSHVPSVPGWHVPAVQTVRRMRQVLGERRRSGYLPVQSPPHPVRRAVFSGTAIPRVRHVPRYTDGGQLVCVRCRCAVPRM
ncbi:hypothetical protein DIPPA_04362 [Diplonema papillatum]|nr:hypothetical protein DIPPA_04362 [Diplonema papillatum]